MLSFYTILYLICSMNVPCHFFIVINHQHVQKSLRNVQHQLSFTKQERKELLGYILEGGSYHDLEGLKLLPIANGRCLWSAKKVQEI